MPDADPVSQARTDKANQAELDAIAEHDEVCWLMVNAKGRRLVWRLLGLAGIYRTTFVSGDALSSAFREGYRAAGIELLNLILKHCPERYPQMQQEARNHATSTSSTSTKSRARTSASRTDYQPGTASTGDASG